MNLKNRFLKSENLGKFTTFDSNFPASRENNKQQGGNTMKKSKYRYFEWGDEKPGYVTTWSVAPDGSVRIGAEISREEARRRGYEFECPFS